MKYKCNDCEHVFEGSSYTTECPECESNSFISFKNGNGGGWLDKIKEWVKENKLIAAVIALFFIFFIFKPGPPPPIVEQPNIYSLRFAPNNPTNQLTVHLIDSTDNIVAYNSSIYSFLDLSATIESEDGNTYRVKVKKNKIEICSAGELTITYKTSSSSGLLSLTGMYTGVKTIAGVNPTKKVGECITNIVLGNVVYQPVPVCKIEVQVLEGVDVLISINGRNGEYQNSSRFNTDGVTIKNFDIWYYPKGFKDEKVQYKDFDKQKVLNSINSSSVPASLPISEIDLKDKLNDMIKLIQQDKIDEADNIFYIIVPYLSKASLSISGKSVSVYSMNTEILSFLDNGGKLKPLHENIDVKASISNCGAEYLVNISL